MRVITLGRAAGIGKGDDHPYKGNAYLLRFGIESADEFFAVQLPFIVDTFGIDPRQIMHLELLGDGRSGLSHVAMCISFEDDCPASVIEACVDKIYNAPALPSQAEHSVNETIRERLIDFLLLGPPAERSRFLRKFKRLMQRVPSRTSPESTLSAGFVSRICYESAPPSITEWRNILLHCSETLRQKFALEHLQRLSFTAIPNTDESYCVEAEFLLPERPRFYRNRPNLIFRQRQRRIQRGAALSFTPQPLRREQSLGKPERSLLNDFDGLDSLKRLRVWRDGLAKFFRT